MAVERDLPRGVHSSKPASPRIRLHDALEKTFLQCIMIALFFVADLCLPVAFHLSQI